MPVPLYHRMYNFAHARILVKQEPEPEEQEPENLSVYSRSRALILIYPRLGSGEGPDAGMV